MNLETVQSYYSQTLKTSDDLKANACCTPEEVPDWLKSVLSNVHDDVLARYYGCGLIAPLSLKGARILDLGCGAGRDVYALAQCVGAEGEVVGVDMTSEQLDIARGHIGWHSDRFGFANVSFHEGFIEKLADLPLEPGSFDVIVSNCVVNLAIDKAAVFDGVFNLLKPGGEFYFSDVYSDRRIPPSLAEDNVLYGECLSGALYWNDFLTMAKAAGFDDPRRVKTQPITVGNPTLMAKLDPIQFLSATYRLFKLDGLETDCEDYGEAVRYRGTVPEAPVSFLLDDHHTFETGRIIPVCGNTRMMLAQTRFAEHFEFFGNATTHFGIFEGCGGESPFNTAKDAAACC